MVIARYIVLFCFFLTSWGPIPQASAQPVFMPKLAVEIPAATAMVKGLTVHPDNPLQFDFIVEPNDVGDGSKPSLSGRVTNPPLRDESLKMIKYFLASLATPEGDMWVNLSPYEKGRVIPDAFGQTLMGRDLLAQDYILKQITSSLIHPDSATGREFWAKVYKEAQAKFGTTNIPINTFNKVWIMPDKASVWEHGNSVFVIERHLKVMLEQDYLAANKQMPTRGHVPTGMTQKVSPSPLPSEQVLNVKAPQGTNQTINETNQIGSQIVRDIVIPILEHEVNEGANFAQLRQIYNSMILATWFKRRLKDSFLGSVYMNKNQTQGVEFKDTVNKQKIYDEYLKAFKKGVFNFIKEEADPTTGTMVPRKYFSGGAVGLKQADLAMLNSPWTRLPSGALKMLPTDKAMKVTFNANPAMRADESVRVTFKSLADISEDKRLGKGIQRRIIFKYKEGGGDSSAQSWREEAVFYKGVLGDELGNSLQLLIGGLLGNAVLHPLKRTREKLEVDQEVSVYEYDQKPILKVVIHQPLISDSNAEAERLWKILQGNADLSLTDLGNMQLRREKGLFINYGSALELYYHLASTGIPIHLEYERDIQGGMTTTLWVQIDRMPNPAMQADSAMINSESVRNTFQLLEDIARPLKVTIAEQKIEEAIRQVDQWIERNKSKTDVEFSVDTQELDQLRQLSEDLNAKFEAMDAAVREQKPKFQLNKVAVYTQGQWLSDESSAKPNIFYDLTDKLTKMMSILAGVQTSLSFGLRSPQPTEQKVVGWALKIQKVLKEKYPYYVQMLEDILNPGSMDLTLDRSGFESLSRPQDIYKYFLIPAFSDAAMQADQEIAKLTYTYLQSEQAGLSEDDIRLIEGWGYFTREDLLFPGYFLSLARENGKLVGVYRFYTGSDEKSVFGAGLSVNPQEQHRSIGTQMVIDLLKHLKNEGAESFLMLASYIPNRTPGEDMEASQNLAQRVYSIVKPYVDDHGLIRRPDGKIEKIRINLKKLDPDNINITYKVAPNPAMQVDSTDQAMVSSSMILSKVAEIEQRVQQGSFLASDYIPLAYWHWLVQLRPDQIIDLTAPQKTDIRDKTITLIQKLNDQLGIRPLLTAEDFSGKISEQRPNYQSLIVSTKEHFWVLRLSDLTVKDGTIEAVEINPNEPVSKPSPQQRITVKLESRMTFKFLPADPAMLYESAVQSSAALRELIRNHGIKLAILDADKPFVLNVVRGMRKYMGLGPAEIVLHRTSPLGQADEDLKDLKIVSREEYFQRTDLMGVTVNVNPLSTRPYILEEKTTRRLYMGLPASPYKNAIHAPLAQTKREKIRRELGIKDRNIIILHSLKQKFETQASIQAYNETYRNVPVAKRPLLIIVPKYGINQIQALLAQNENKIVIRDTDKVALDVPFPDMSDSNVLILNTYGELRMLYGLGNVVAVINPDQNLSEAVDQGVAVLAFQEGVENNKNAYDYLFSSQGVIPFSKESFIHLVTDNAARQEQGQRGLEAIQSFQAVIKEQVENDVTILLQALREKSSRLANHARPAEFAMQADSAMSTNDELHARVINQLSIHPNRLNSVWDYLIGNLVKAKLSFLEPFTLVDIGSGIAITTIALKKKLIEADRSDIEVIAVEPSPPNGMDEWLRAFQADIKTIRYVKDEHHLRATHPSDSKKIKLITMFNVSMYFQDKKAQLINEASQKLAEDGFMVVGDGEFEKVQFLVLQKRRDLDGKLKLFPVEFISEKDIQKHAYHLRPDVKETMKFWLEYLPDPDLQQRYLALYSKENGTGLTDLEQYYRINGFQLTTSGLPGGLVALKFDAAMNAEIQAQWQAIGVSKEVLVKARGRYDKFDTLNPVQKMEEWEAEGLSQEDMVQAVILEQRLVGIDVRQNLRPKLNMIRRMYGAKPSNIISKLNEIFSQNVQVLQAIMDMAVQRGIGMTVDRLKNIYRGINKKIHEAYKQNVTDWIERHTNYRTNKEFLTIIEETLEEMKKKDKPLLGTGKDEAMQATKFNYDSKDNSIGRHFTQHHRLDVAWDWLKNNSYLNLSSLEDASLVDVGTSTGETSIDLARQLEPINSKIHIVSVDPRPVQEEAASNPEVPSNIKFVRDDNRLSKLAELNLNPIKIITMFNVTIHYPGKEAELIHELSLKLEDGGLLLVGQGDQDTMEFIVFRKMNGQLIPLEIVSRNRRLQTPKFIVQQFLSYLADGATKQKYITQYVKPLEATESYEEETGFDLKEAFKKAGLQYREISSEYIALVFDSAMQANDLGGIDMNSKWLDLNIKRDRDGLPLPAAAQDWSQIRINGIEPVIIRMELVNLKELIGV